ncbi:ATP-binding region, ATPase-like protein [Shewanella denitrificans OS217]|uniref:histidine kinase n=1 Tax=Shewanella denitrificans (strain OS217 / ATCC BAA-1090 / DSM 15013) TaxID=318161 RepID=Q12KA1_SHEDO|nr:ATP-binding protein [Shewanella denitrificans]ABE56125.1 ATP-binding region, ATPase-like protein [Shewanella denitrificans OS217]
MSLKLSFLPWAKWSPMGKLSIVHKMMLISLLASVFGFLLATVVWLYTQGDFLLTGAIAAMLASSLMAWRLSRSFSHSLSALEVGLLNFKDNDFSVSLSTQGEGDFDNLALLYNQAAAQLRSERQFIYQRELLLDKVIQNSPNVMLLVDAELRIIYANTAARQLLHQGQLIEGLCLKQLCANLAPSFSEFLLGDKEGLFSLGEAEPETWHISRGQFSLNNQKHNLILLKQLTRELNRQEVAVWKKVIRIISHELNNSVAPIASMVNSGRLLTQDIDKPQLKLIFDTIENRTSHLSEFISHYAHFAKLPMPQRKIVDWGNLTAQLGQHYRFNLKVDLPQTPSYLDTMQLEQVLINLLKNAHESGSAVDAISLSIVEMTQPISGVTVCVEDAGSGMSSDVLEQALLPFYSTKQSGTGLGLPLCREIVEAHGGRISLQNRVPQGLKVSLWLPNEDA